MGLRSTLFGGSESAGQKIDPNQLPFLKDLWQRGQMASYGNQGQNFAQQFEQPAFGAFNQMAQGGSQIPGLQQGLQNFGQMQDQNFQGTVQAGLGDINRNFQQNIMPQISQGSALTGTSGGSREGIAQGLAAQGANRQAGDFVNRMYSGNFQNNMQNQLSAYGGLSGLQGQQNQAMGQAMGYAPQLQNLGFNSQYGSLQGLSSLIGSPTTLGGGSKQTGAIFQPIKLN